MSSPRCGPRCFYGLNYSTWNHIPQLLPLALAEHKQHGILSSTVPGASHPVKADVFLPGRLSVLTMRSLRNRPRQTPYTTNTRIRGCDGLQLKPRDDHHHTTRARLLEYHTTAINPMIKAKNQDSKIYESLSPLSVPWFLNATCLHVGKLVFCLSYLATSPSS